MNPHTKETLAGDRFEFGKNWDSFLSLLDPARIRTAEESLCQMLDLPSLVGKSFLDIGSGSGLFSLAAANLGARVHSFDYDPMSVGCTSRLRERFHPGKPGWTVQAGSVLEPAYLGSLGQFDVVYSWGVLHHTGSMWQALENVVPLVARGGKLFIAIYNDQGPWSRRWSRLKRIYNRLPAPLKLPYAVLVMGPRELRLALGQLLRGRLLAHLRSYGSNRGMDRWHDMLDWIGGYPFEVAKPEEIFDFYRRHGFHLERLTTLAGGSGCNEYVFSRP